MPIYDYLCTECDHRADILHGLNDPGPNFCPSCGKEGTMRKQFAAPTIHFKGSGWAKKDRGASVSTRAARAAADKPGEKAESKGDHKADQQGDSRPETKGEPTSDAKSSGSSSSSGGSSSDGSSTSSGD
jgi:putative FmdB family regulatory protein